MTLWSVFQYPVTHMLTWRVFAETVTYIIDEEYLPVSLSTYLIAGIDMKTCGFLKKNASRAQPDNNIFLQHAAIKSIGTMLLAP